MSDPVTRSSQVSSGEFIPDPLDVEIQRSRRQREFEARDKGKDPSNTPAPKGNTRSILSPSALIQAAAVPSGLAANADTFGRLNNAWRKVYDIDTVTQSHCQRSRDLTEQLERTNRKLQGAQGRLTTRGGEIQTTELPAKQTQLTAATTDAQAKRAAFDTAKQAKKSAEAAAKTAVQDLEQTIEQKLTTMDPSIPQALRDRLTQTRATLAKCENTLQTGKKAKVSHLGLLESNVEKAKEGVETATQEIRESIRASETARLQAIKIANKAKGPASLQVVNTEKRLDAARGKVKIAQGELKELKTELKVLTDRPTAITKKITEINQSMSQGATELQNGINTARAGRVTAVAEALPGRGGQLARAYSASDEFARTAASSTKFTGKIASAIADVPLLGSALDLLGKVLLPIGAIFAGVDCVKELYNAFTASEEKSKAWTQALCNVALTVGAAVFGLATGGLVPLMIYAGLGNLAYTLGKSILNGDLKKSVDWLWGTA